VSLLQESERVGARETLQLLARAFRYAAPFKERFFAKFLLLLASLAPMLVMPWPLKILVDHVVEGRAIGAEPLPYPSFIEPIVATLVGRSPEQIVFWVVLFSLAMVFLVGAAGSGSNERDQADAYLAGGHDQATRTENEANAGFSMASGLLGLLDFRFTLRLTQAVNHHYRSRLFERIQSLPMTAFDDERIGDAVFRVMYDTPAITSAVYRIVLTPLASLVLGLLVVWLLGTLFGDHPILWHSALALLVLAFLTSLPFAGALRRRSGRSRRAGATTTATLEEGLTNILAVQSLGAEGREQLRFGRDSWASFSQHRSVMALGMLIFAAGLLPGLFVVSRVFFYVADLEIRGVISTGDFMLLFSYFGMLAFSCIEVGALWIRLQEASAGLQRVFFLMDLPAELDAPDARPFPPLRHAVRFDGVGYRYPDGTPALHDVTFCARLGQITALAGPAGAGKTTLASLIPRFLTPSAGRVCFDGSDAAHATLASLREQVAFVFQETILFDASVEENIRLGRPEASEAEIRRAARIAGADDFIRALPQGYSTPLGRAGGKLSVGQKQRLSIARALVRAAPILILDEPTSALDPATEQRLVAALREASRTRLVLVIAHRLSTIREADQILFLEAGRIVERGSHDELMARREGAYRRFVELQTRGAA